MRGIVAAVIVALVAVGDAAPGWIDTPAWPAGSRIALAWLVYPTVSRTYHGMDNTQLTPLKLVATIGGVSRVVTFDLQFGALQCPHELGHGEVAKIEFEEGGFGGELVRRAGSDAVEIADWSQEDGACPGPHGEPVACKPREKLVARMHVPPNATFAQAVYEVDAAGARHPFACPP